MMNVKIKWVIALTLFISKGAFSAINSGQITIVNGLANGVNTGSTVTSFVVQVSDSLGTCSVAKLVVYGGSVVLKWDATKTHSASQCTGIASVSILPQKTIIGSTSTIIYDQVTSTPVPALSATGPTVYFAPTTVVANLALLVTGTGIPASAQSVSATAWGIGAAAAPVFNGVNGDLTTVGVPGGVGMAGLKAEEFAKTYGVTPYSTVLTLLN